MGGEQGTTATGNFVFISLTLIQSDTDFLKFVILCQKLKKTKQKKNPNDKTAIMCFALDNHFRAKHTHTHTSTDQCFTKTKYLKLQEGFRSIETHMMMMVMMRMMMVMVMVTSCVIFHLVLQMKVVLSDLPVPNPLKYYHLILPEGLRNRNPMTGCQNTSVGLCGGYQAKSSTSLPSVLSRSSLVPFSRTATLF